MGGESMARYVCPSCGGVFNGKKCKNCCYEALEESQMPRIHRTLVSPVPRQQGPEISPSPRSSRGYRPDAREKAKPKRRHLGTVLLVLILGWPLLQTVFGLLWSGGVMLESQLRKPEAILPEPGTYQEIYSDEILTVQADLRSLREEGIIPILAENHTNAALDIYADEVILNDNLLSRNSALYFSVEKSSVGQGDFYLESLNLEGSSGYPSRVSFRLCAWNPKSGDVVLETDPITLTASEETVVPCPRPEGLPAARAEGVELTYLGWEDLEDFPSSRLRFGMVNDTDRYLSFYCDSALVNGQEVLTGMYCTLPPHTIGYDRLFFFDLEELNLHSPEELESIELYLGIYDGEAPVEVTEFPAFSVPLP